MPDRHVTDSHVAALQSRLDSAYGLKAGQKLTAVVGSVVGAIQVHGQGQSEGLGQGYDLGPGQGDDLGQWQHEGQVHSQGQHRGGSMTRDKGSGRP